MNDLALKKMGVDPFVVIDDEEEKKAGGVAYLANLFAERRLSPKKGEMVAIDELQQFDNLLARKAFQERATEVLAGLGDELVGLSQGTIDLAERFLGAWPSGLPAPEVSAEPDGEVVFDWACLDGRNFSVSLREDARIAFAGAYGGGKTLYGTDHFQDSIPDEVVEAVRELRG